MDPKPHNNNNNTASPAEGANPYSAAMASSMLSSKNQDGGFDPKQFLASLQSQYQEASKSTPSIDINEDPNWTDVDKFLKTIKTPTDEMKGLVDHLLATMKRERATHFGPNCHEVFVKAQSLRAEDTLNEHEAPTTPQFTNSTSMKMQVACAVLDRGPQSVVGHLETFGLVLGNVLGSRQFQFGQTVPLVPQEKAQVLLGSNSEGAVLLVFYGYTKKEMKQRQAKADKEEYERNKQIAEEEAKWESSEEFLNGRNGGEQVLDMLKQYGGLSDSAVKGSRFRCLGRGAPRKIPAVPMTYASVVWSLAAELKNGEQAPGGHPVVRQCHPQYGIATPIEHGRFAMDDGFSSYDSNRLVGYVLEDDVEWAYLVRVPMLAADTANNPKMQIIQQIMASLNNKENNHDLPDQFKNCTISTDTIGNASRKERTCSGCGVVKREKMKVCSRCHKERYCSRACQAGHWKESHKLFCHVAE